MAWPGRRGPAKVKSPLLLYLQVDVHPRCDLFASVSPPFSLGRYIYIPGPSGITTASPALLPGNLELEEPSLSDFIIPL